ncbi:MAG: molybdopterin adenylyltransferase [Candidatus Aceula meridiana]|nr:molybdopterin adenylyltransferase [Candidatus Aceula meridiana]
MVKSSKIKIGILITSDRASKGKYKDTSGKVIDELLKSYIESPFTTIYRLVPDVQKTIEKTLEILCDCDRCSLVVTSGGTGPAKRDVTPEATKKVCSKILPGFGEAMRAVSIKKVPTAILSRQTAGIRSQSLIINLPGSPKAIEECLETIFSAIPDCLDLIGAPEIQCTKKIKNAYRHKNKNPVAATEP